MSVGARESDTPLHSLFSPEGVRLELPIAGPAPRMFAYGIDLFIIIALLVLLVVALVLILPLGNSIDNLMQKVFHEAARRAIEQNKGQAPQLGALGGLILALFVLAQFVIETGYFIFWEMVTNGQSAGKIVAGLRVVRRDGMPIDLKSSVLRNVLRIVDILPENYVVGLVSMLLSSSGERLGDHVAGTIVIRLDRPQAARDLEPPQKTTSQALTRAQLARLGPREIQLLRATLRRIPSLNAHRSNALLEEVATTIRARLEIDESTDDPLGFLREVLSLAERYSRD